MRAGVRGWPAAGAALWLAAAAVSAQPLAPPPVPPEAGIEQRLGAALPADLRFTDSDGRTWRLGELLGGPPLLIAFGYYRCPRLCGLLMHGLLQGLHDSGLPPAAYRIVRVSIDPGDTPASARVQRALNLGYVRQLGSPPPQLELLVGETDAIAALAQRVGFRSSPVDDAGAADFAHPAAVIVVTPQGRVSRYLMGVAFDGPDLRRAVHDASAEQMGGLARRIALLCAHIDPRLGRHSEAVMLGMQVLGLSLAALLAARLARWRWHERDRAAPRGPPR